MNGKNALVGSSPGLDAVRRAIGQVATTDATVLILGETGTGKELLARLIHEQSPRRSKSFVPVSCAALAPGLITSELFGHEAGAFTGAQKRRIGRFEQADGGTLFLDEIGEMPAEAQAIFLRVLQERVIERVGSGDAVPIDIRVVAATNRNLPNEVAAGKFRADLFYRLNVFPIFAPPLRDRRMDIPELATHFLRLFADKHGRQASEIRPDTMTSFDRARTQIEIAIIHPELAGCWTTFRESASISSPQSPETSRSPPQSRRSCGQPAPIQRSVATPRFRATQFDFLLSRPGP